MLLFFFCFLTKGLGLHWLLWVLGDTFDGVEGRCREMILGEVRGLKTGMVGLLSVGSS